MSWRCQRLACPSMHCPLNKTSYCRTNGETRFEMSMAPDCISCIAHIVTNDLPSALPCILRVLNYRNVDVHFVLGFPVDFVPRVCIKAGPKQYARAAVPTTQIGDPVSVLDNEE